LYLLIKTIVETGKDKPAQFLLEATQFSLSQLLISEQRRREFRKCPLLIQAVASNSLEVNEPLLSQFIMYIIAVTLCTNSISIKGCQVIVGS
jgi:hypothetical protein